MVHKPAMPRLSIWRFLIASNTVEILNSSFVGGPLDDCGRAGVGPCDGNPG